MQQQIAQVSTYQSLFQDFSSFWIVGVVPIVLAWIGYRSLALKVKASNDARRARIKRKWEEEGKIFIDSMGDETVMGYVRERMKKRAK